jgi:hypothetical protein
LCQQGSGDAATAQALYQQAHAGQRNIPAFRGQASAESDSALPIQAIAAGRLFELPGDGRVVVARLTVGQVVAAEFEKRGLLWPTLERSFDFIELRSLKEK